MIYQQQQNKFALKLFYLFINRSIYFVWQFSFACCAIVVGHITNRNSRGNSTVMNILSDFLAQWKETRIRKFSNRINIQFDLIKIDLWKKNNCVYVTAHTGFCRSEPQKALQFVKNWVGCVCERESEIERLNEWKISSWWVKINQRNQSIREI